MKIVEFLEALLKKSDEEVEAYFDVLIQEYANDSTDEEIEQFIWKIPLDAFSYFCDRLLLLHADAETRMTQLTDLQIGTDYYKKLQCICETLAQVLLLATEIEDKRVEQLFAQDVGSADTEPEIDETEVISQNANVIRELKQSVENLRSNLKATEKDLHNATDKFDERIDTKIASVLINTVSILGIFVAIAFAGFGTLSMINNINLNAMMQSIDSFAHGLFILCTVALFAYNLLLLLVYFIFKLSRPVQLGSIDDENQSSGQRKFTQEVSLKLFIVIDLVVFALTIALFVWCLQLHKPLEVEKGSVVVQEYLETDVSATLTDENITQTTLGSMQSTQ